MKSSGESLEDYLNFWQRNQQVLPKLSELALSIATASGSSAKIESVFSMSSMSFAGRRSRIIAKTVETETLLKYNYKLIE